ncbi:Arp complex subunit [Polyrhizophydium stewartii]|uniref:Arp2/3 complex 34 kDa subunit n=1 Tax=Polyrhizophydium stewartii TaxID=2732419 RepID=A0ABR4N1W3_9FUNG
MILLEPASKILEETIRERLNSEPERCQIGLADFDGVTYRISTPESKTQLVVSVAIRCFPELQRYGAEAVLAREYGPLFGAPEAGYDVSLYIDLTTLPADREPIIKAISLLKRNIMAAPFEAAFAAQQEGRESEMMAVHYRDEEAIYIKALHDRVTVIFSTEFKDETDKIYGKVFLQEFVDARRLPALQNTPQVLYSAREPPLELRGVPGVKDSNTVSYVTFVLFPRHFQGAAAYDAISRIQLFRDYFHFHIKASKAYMHSRMRTRVDSFLKVLNRAKPEKPEDQKEKKTASGKTFKRS